MTTTLFYNCRLFRAGEIVSDDLWVKDGKVVDPSTVDYAFDKSVDCDGVLIAPGFVDVKVNGAFGVDFTSPKEVAAGLPTVRRGLLKHGVTSILPSVITTNPEVYKEVLPLLTPAAGSAESGAEILGAHLDGPFISREKSGGHSTADIQDVVSVSVMDATYGEGWRKVTKVVALAPELAGAQDVIADLTKDGIIVSLGHSAASYCQGKAAVNAGATMLSHLFNAMPAFHHRDPSLVGLLASSDLERPLFFGIIADGIHTHEAAQRMAHKISPETLILLSDGTAAVGLERGTYEMGGQSVEVKGTPPAAFVAGTDNLLGSVATLDQCVRRLRRNTECSIEEALLAATFRPAKLLGLEHRKGSLAFGADADFLFLNSRLDVLQTYVAGELAFQGGEMSTSSDSIAQ